jgi:hypothetical protein
MFQALLLGRTPYATELCRGAVEVVRCMWKLLSPDTGLDRSAQDLDRIIGEYNPAIRYDSQIKRTKVRVEELRPWYNPLTFNKLMYLSLCEARCSNPGTRAALRISLSAILKAVCETKVGAASRITFIRSLSNSRRTATRSVTCGGMQQSYYAT